MQKLTLTAGIEKFFFFSSLSQDCSWSRSAFLGGLKDIRQMAFSSRWPWGVGCRNVQGQRSLWPEEKSLSQPVTHLSPCLRLSHPSNLLLPPHLHLLPCFSVSCLPLDMPELYLHLLLSQSTERENKVSTGLHAVTASTTWVWVWNPNCATSQYY